MASSQTSTGSSSGGAAKTAGPLKMSAIPDQDPEKLNRLYSTVAKRFAAATGLDVQYQPVTDYPAVVRAFEIGDVYLARMGGLTGVQARSRVPRAQANRSARYRCRVPQPVHRQQEVMAVATAAEGVRPAGSARHPYLPGLVNSGPDTQLDCPICHPRASIPAPRPVKIRGRGRRFGGLAA